MWNIKLPRNPFFLKLTNYTPHPWVQLQFLFQHWWRLEQSTTNKEILNLFFFCDDSILFWTVKLVLCFLTLFFFWVGGWGDMSQLKTFHNLFRSWYKTVQVILKAELKRLVRFRHTRNNSTYNPLQGNREEW